MQILSLWMLPSRNLGFNGKLFMFTIDFWSIQSILRYPIRHLPNSHWHQWSANVNFAKIFKIITSKIHAISIIFVEFWNFLELIILHGRKYWFFSHWITFNFLNFYFRGWIWESAPKFTIWLYVQITNKPQKRTRIIFTMSR